MDMNFDVKGKIEELVDKIQTRSEEHTSELQSLSC